ncbi:MAG: molybdopterin molybdotransferase MoeA [Chloroflexi bacterium]|jgi:molybdopterin molybdotransferase|nr:molybdopterin molybdotransferase MoeA [Chloroflexota bacterium]
MPERETYPILSVEEALERILSFVHRLPAESVPILDALDRVLAEDVLADSDVPPLDNSAMDGFAVRAEDVSGASREQPARLRVVGELAAGQTTDQVVGAGEALRIMTGAPVPQGADTVVRFEDTRTDDGHVEILVPVKQGRNVRYAGEDVRRGSVVLHAGSIVRPQEVGMLANVGRTTVQVIRRPRVAILATGDEVVPIDAQPGAGKIRNINSYSNAAQVRRHGGVPLLLGIARDQSAELGGKIREGLDAGADLFVTSGGVSAGDFDLVKKVLAAEGQIDFWWVNMKPGRPMAFGTIGGIPLLALPGNPVAAMISLELFGRPAIRKMMGYTDWEWPAVTARLRDAVARKDNRRHYLRVRLQPGADGVEAVLTGDQGSGILTSMVQADGLAVIPEDCDHLPAGSPVKVLLLQ